MKKILLFALPVMLALTSCATPPRIAVTTQVRKTSESAGRLIVTIKNIENRPSTPILLEVSLQSGSAAPLRVIHPAPFVLNKQETREIIAPFVSTAGNLQPVVELRIAQTGVPLKPVSVQALPPTSPMQVPATAAPAIPQPRGR